MLAYFGVLLFVVPKAEILGAIPLTGSCECEIVRSSASKKINVFIKIMNEIKQ